MYINNHVNKVKIIVRYNIIISNLDSSPIRNDIITDKIIAATIEIEGVHTGCIFIIVNSLNSVIKFIMFRSTVFA